MDLLSDILSHMKLKGTLYFRTAFTSPWSVQVPAFEKVARFHFAHKGRCLVRIEADKPPVPLNQGDLLIVTRGAGHTLYCDPTTESPATHLDRVIEESGFDGTGALVYGTPGSHHETQLICGHFAFDEMAEHPLIDKLPSHIHIKNYGESAGVWMDHTLRVIGAEAGKNAMGSEIIALKLSEIIFAQALRSYLSDEQHLPAGLRGYADTRIAKSLTAIHQNPAHAWSLQDLAQEAGLSRTAFATRFAELLDMTPIGYITNWRMQIARRMLLETDSAIIAIAEAIGYQSEAAFGRVFKKTFDIAPGSFRKSGA